MQMIENGKTYIVRTIDEFGAILIPKEYRLIAREPRAYKITAQTGAGKEPPKVFLDPVTVDDLLSAGPEDDSILSRAQKEDGRVCIPQTMLAVLGDVRAVKLFWEEKRLTLEPYTQACALCGSEKFALVYKGRNICDDCICALYQERFVKTKK